MRAGERPFVSTPLAWEEVEAAAKRRGATKLAFTTDDVLMRVEKDEDVFEPVVKLKQKLPNLDAGALGV